MRCFKDKIIFNFLFFEEIALRERKFPGTAQKTLEVQLTLGCKDEKDKCYTKEKFPLPSKIKVFFLIHMSNADFYCMQINQGH